MSANSQTQKGTVHDDELEQLRELLFDKEFKEIEQLRKHLLDRQQRITDTADILVDSIHVAATDQEKLVTALSDPVNQCISTIVSEKPQEFADSLFPVMGPAIRKSISETLKSFVQSTNQMIEQSMSPKSLRWRWEAKRSGVPFSEIVLKYSLLYRVEEVFLIQQGTGLLIEHVSHPEVLEHDSDAISAMLTVIRDFSRDSFSTEASDSLQTVEFGERTLWMFDGPKAILACVNRGLVPKTNRVALQAVLEEFHSLYSAEIEQFSGDRSQNHAFQTLLETCLTQQNIDPEVNAQAQSGSRPWYRKPLIWLLLMAALLSGYWFWTQYDENTRFNALLADLKSMHGIVIISAENKAGKRVVKGLLDPLVPVLYGLIDKHGFTNDELQFEMALYQSLDPEIAILRAARFLDAPETLALAVKGQKLVLNGIVSQKWLDSAVRLRDRIPGFNDVNFDQVIIDDASRLALIRQQLNPPDTIKLRLEKQRLFVTGTASAQWISNLNQQSVLSESNLSLQTVDAGNRLLSNEKVQVTKLIEHLNGLSFYFSDGIMMSEMQETELQDRMNKIKQLVALLKTINGHAKYVVSGFVDGVGDVAGNNKLKLMRANFIKQQLVQSGVNSGSISVVAGNRLITDRRTNLSLRRAFIEVSMVSPD